jgi:hypothetical protein
MGRLQVLRQTQRAKSVVTRRKSKFIEAIKPAVDSNLGNIYVSCKADMEVTTKIGYVKGCERGDAMRRLKEAFPAEYERTVGTPDAEVMKVRREVDKGIGSGVEWGVAEVKQEKGPASMLIAGYITYLGCSIHAAVDGVPKEMCYIVTNTPNCNLNKTLKTIVPVESRLNVNTGRISSRCQGVNQEGSKKAIHPHPNQALAQVQSKRLIRRQLW